MKPGDLLDRLSILELREFMTPRLTGHRDVDIEQEVTALRRDESSPMIGRTEEFAKLQKLNTRIWMLQHVEEELARIYVNGDWPEFADALTAVGMICRLVAQANAKRAEIVARLNGEPNRKVY